MTTEYISRETAVNGIYNCPTERDSNNYIWVRASDVEHMLDNILPANVQPVVKGEWIELHEHQWKKYDGSDKIDPFAGVDFEFHNGPLCVKCGLSFCEHCEPEKYLSVCPVPHYKCSICGHESDTNSPFCPNCGADMRKKNEK